MTKIQKSFISEYIYQNRMRVLINIIFSALGVIMGGFAFLNYIKNGDSGFFYDSVSVLSDTGSKQVFFDALWDNLFVVVIFYLFSLFSVGEFLSSAYVLIRCVSYGMSACILINAYGIKGALVCTLALLPQCIFYITALIIFATETAKQCRYMGSCFDKALRRRAIFSYFTVSLVPVFLIFMGCLVEGFCSKHLMLWCVKNFLKN